MTNHSSSHLPVALSVPLSAPLSVPLSVTPQEEYQKHMDDFCSKLQLDLQSTFSRIDTELVPLTLNRYCVVCGDMCGTWCGVVWRHMFPMVIKFPLVKTVLCLTAMCLTSLSKLHFLSLSL